MKKSSTEGKIKKSLTKLPILPWHTKSRFVVAKPVIAVKNKVNSALTPRNETMFMLSGWLVDVAASVTVVIFVMVVIAMISCFISL